MAFLDLVKIFLIPLSISAALYFLIFFVALPLYRQHYARYSQYLPLQFTNSSNPNSYTNASSLRARVQNAVLGPMARLAYVGVMWLRSRGRVVSGVDGEDSDDEDGPGGTTLRRSATDAADGDEELEQAVWNGFDRPQDAPRSQSRSDSSARLSVDLEQGFRDSSDEES